MPPQRHDRPRHKVRGRGRAALAAALTSAGLTAAAAGTAAFSLTSAGPIDAASPTAAATLVTSQESSDGFDAPALDDAAPQVQVPVAQIAFGNADLTAVPLQALTAYQRAAQVIDDADQKCQVDWTLIAAVGQVVSLHGLVGGGHLTGSGVVKPALVGDVVRSKTGDRFADTDAGRLDGDKRHDRAIGPMLLAPTTWGVVGVDADADGRRNPQDIDDASLAVAVLLCNGRLDLRNAADERQAVARVNGDRTFVRAVLAAAGAYAAQAAGTGTTTVVTGPYVTPPELPTVLPARVAVPARTPSDAVTPATLHQTDVLQSDQTGTDHPSHPSGPPDVDTTSPPDDPSDTPSSETPSDDPTDCASETPTDGSTDGPTDPSDDPTDDLTDDPGDLVCESPSDEPTTPSDPTSTPAP